MLQNIIPYFHILEYGEKFKFDQYCYCSDPFINSACDLSIFKNNKFLKSTGMQGKSCYKMAKFLSISSTITKS